jgi:hypothetical protein
VSLLLSLVQSLCSVAALSKNDKKGGNVTTARPARRAVSSLFILMICDDAFGFFSAGQMAPNCTT